MSIKVITIAILQLMSMAIIGLGTANAHRAIAFASFDGENVTVEGYFPGGEAIRNGEVRVVDSKHTVIATGKTDSKGYFSFKPQGVPPLTITIKAGPGHIAKTIINPEISVSPSSEGDLLYGGPVEEDMHRARDPQDRVRTELSSNDLKRLLAAIQALHNTVDELRKEQEKVQIRDIIGGIGYIFGIMGIWALIKSRRQKDDVRGIGPR